MQYKKPLTITDLDNPVLLFEHGCEAAQTYKNKGGEAYRAHFYNIEYNKNSKKNRPKIAFFVHYPLGFNRTQNIHRIYIYCDLYNHSKHLFHINCKRENKKVKCKNCDKYFVSDYNSHQHWGLNHFELELDIINPKLIWRKIENSKWKFFNEFKKNKI